MAITGYLTLMLKPEYVAAGYRLEEDEDFLYLYGPDGVKYIFNGHATTIESVEDCIETLKVKNDCR